MWHPYARSCTHLRGSAHILGHRSQIKTQQSSCYSYCHVLAHSSILQIISRPFDSHIPFSTLTQTTICTLLRSSPVRTYFPSTPAALFTSSQPHSKPLPVSPHHTQHARLIFHSVSVPAHGVFGAHGCRTARLSAKHKHKYTG